MEKKNRKFRVASIIITLASVLLGVIGLVVLPENIVIQWNSGDASKVVDKINILIFPGLSLVLLFYGKVIVQYFLFRNFNEQNEIISSYINMNLLLLFLTCELYTFLYAFGLRITIGTILIVQIIIGGIWGIKIASKR